MTRKNEGNRPLRGESASSRELPPSGFIDLGAVYTVAEFKRHLGWSDAMLRAARRRGLKVLRSGKRAYVCGHDFVDFLRDESDARQLSPQRPSDNHLKNT